ncbi:uncharacterized protein LOC114388245 isoform X1 [Glycine soja]|uniref:DRBM domain-containing protein n=1 Tax=Glycine soja TaxID=3848 RepID=A0A445GNG3_GLYSO|nr:uncharacterized protein LOC114388245 isoform X1 [Glycine soja]RZB62796.1 hypothetical protein D0Y65_039820 [Glycine soja]
MASSSDVCPTEDALKAFLEYLVDPVLPAKPSTPDNPPSPSQQHLVAKQVHSVVLLYNYYHRKQYPELAFLPFVEFCKLALVLRPTLSVHMKSMLKPDETELVEQLSLTEDKILNACNICTCLDASKNVPDVEGWPISKVSVLLIDSKKENCFLLFSYITEGVWSVVEKDVDTFSQSSEITSGAIQTYKKRRVIKKPTKKELNSEEDGILQIGYSAVKEAAGINKTDITSFESYTVYSQSKVKTASRFYIMKCSQLINKEFIQPIKSLIERLRGPLINRSSSCWTVTSVVEYFHVLPYSEIISEWISRETFSNSLQGSRLAEKNTMMGCPEVKKSYISSEGMSIGLDIKPSIDAIEALNQNENNGSCAVTCSASIKETQNVYVDNTLASPSKNKEECQHIANTLQVNEDQEIENPFVQHYSNRSKNPIKAEYGGSTRMLITEGGTKDQSKGKILSKTAKASFENDPTEECVLIAYNPISDLEKFQTIASNGKTLSKTAEASFENDPIEERALIAYHPISDLEKFQTIASKGKALSQIAKASSENDSIEECALIANNPNSDLEKLQIIASKGMTLSQTAKASFENDSIKECALITNNLNSDLGKLQILIASKGKSLSQTALNALMQKRNALALQQRMIEDEIALCDKKIQRMLTRGEDDLELSIESLIEGCNDTWVRNQGRTCQHLEDQHLPPYIKQRRLTEAVLIMQSPCEELDGICRENSWLLPIYRVSESNGGFQATVAVKGLDFECSCGGNLCAHPHEARDSAAAQMLANLRNMAKSDH